MADPSLTARQCRSVRALAVCQLALLVVVGVGLVVLATTESAGVSGVAGVVTKAAGFGVLAATVAKVGVGRGAARSGSRE